RWTFFAMRVCCTAEGARWPATIWEVDAPQSPGGCRPLGYRRSIVRGHWVFSESGEWNPFEQIERYAERRRRDCFTREMLHTYLQHFGIEALTDELLHVDAGSPLVCLQQVTNVWHTPEYTLDQVVAALKEMDQSPEYRFGNGCGESSQR